MKRLTVNIDDNCFSQIEKAAKVFQCSPGVVAASLLMNLSGPLRKCAVKAKPLVRGK